MKGLSVKTSLRVVAGALLLVSCALPSLARAECKVVNYGMMQVEVVGQRATTMVGVNGKDTRFMLDTGATFGFLARANVEALGLKREAAPFGMRMSGVGGSTSVDLTRVKDLGLLGVTLHDMSFLVGGSDQGMGLIGANLLDVFDADIDLANGRLKLFRPSGCGNLAMAYWAKDGQFQTADLRHAEKETDRRSFVEVMINGRPARALLDTGAQATVITRKAAERVGIDMSKADASKGLVSRGVGAQSHKSWIVPVDTYAVGTETIQHSKMEVIDTDFGEGSDAPDLLLGIDFFLAHHVYIANSQRKIYFTYNGGRVFTFGKAPGATASPAKDAGDGAKLSAADYALRGQGHLSRGEIAEANADLDAAIAQAPDVASYRLTRARTRLAARKPDEAMDDLGVAIRLDDQNIDALLLRARIRYARRDKAAAEQDVEAARKLAPAGSARTRLLASFYVAMERPGEALPLYDDWVRLHPEDADLPDVLNARCWARGLANQQLEGAVSDCNRAIRAGKDQGLFYGSLGLVQLRQGRNGEAQASYEKALSLSARSAWVHYGLGLAYLRQGQSQKGEAEIAAAKAINSGIAALAGRYGLTS